MANAARASLPNLHRARFLRREMTIGEVKLWAELQDLNRDFGTHFRRQAPIGRFISDFCEHTRKLIIEVDGCHHDEPKQAVQDAERTKWLGLRGYRVIRFSNADVAQTIEGVMTEVMAAAGILGADSSIALDALSSPRTVSIKIRARIERQSARVIRREKKSTPSPNPSPQGGGGPASPASVGASGEVQGRSGPSAVSANGAVPDGVASSVPSPLVGEGQGGGYLSGREGNKGIAP
jgi:very-short-patch-repair endonuclease